MDRCLHGRDECLPVRDECTVKMGLAINNKWNLFDSVIAFLIAFGIVTLFSCTLPHAKLIANYEVTKTDSLGQKYLPLAYNVYFSTTGSSKYHSARIDVQCCDGWKTLPANGYTHWCKPGKYKAVLTIKDEHGNIDKDEVEIVVK